MQQRCANYIYIISNYTYGQWLTQRPPYSLWTVIVHESVCCQVQTIRPSCCRDSVVKNQVHLRQCTLFPLLLRTSCFPTLLLQGIKVSCGLDALRSVSLKKVSSWPTRGVASGRPDPAVPLVRA